MIKKLGSYRPPRSIKGKMLKVISLEQTYAHIVYSCQNNLLNSTGGKIYEPSRRQLRDIINRMVNLEKQIDDVMQRKNFRDADRGAFDEPNFMAEIDIYELYKSAMYESKRR